MADGNGFEEGTAISASLVEKSLRVDVLLGRWRDNWRGEETGLYTRSGMARGRREANITCPSPPIMSSNLQRLHLSWIF